MDARQKHTTAQAQRMADLFNQVCPIGTPVRYWRGALEGPGAEGRTRSEAEERYGVAVVFIEGCSGFVALSHVETPASSPLALAAPAREGEQ